MLARYLVLANKEEEEDNTVVAANNTKNTNGNVDAHLAVEGLDLDNVDPATRSLIKEQSRILDHLRYPGDDISAMIFFGSFDIADIIMVF